MSPASVRELRLQLGLNQFQLGELLGVNQTTVSLWENGASITKPFEILLQLISARPEIINDLILIVDRLNEKSEGRRSKTVKLGTGTKGLTRSEFLGYVSEAFDNKITDVVSYSIVDALKGIDFSSHETITAFEVSPRTILMGRADTGDKTWFDRRAEENETVHFYRIVADGKEIDPGPAYRNKGIAVRVAKRLNKQLKLMDKAGWRLAAAESRIRRLGKPVALTARPDL